MEEVKTRKIRYMNMVGKNKGLKKTEKQIEANKKSATLLGIKYGKDPEVIKKRSEKLKGRITNPESLFKPGNQFGKLRKGIKMSEEQKKFLSMIQTGKPCSERHKEIQRKMMLERNPMKNPEICKKQHLSLKGKRPDVGLRNIINNPLKNPESLKKLNEKLIGRKLSDTHKKNISLGMKKNSYNNPMKNPQIVKKNYFKKKEVSNEKEY